MSELNKLENWKRLAYDGTSGDMVWSILRDWEADVTDLKQALQPLGHQDCESWGCNADSHKNLGCPPEKARQALSPKRKQS